MTSARDQILGNIRKSLGRTELSAQTAASLEARLAKPTANIIPARGQGDLARRTETFLSEAERVAATTDRVASLADVPAAVAHYLTENDLPRTLKVSPDPLFQGISFDALTVVEGPISDTDPVSVTGAFAAIAETGTLMLLSGPESPTRLNFLPGTHIVVLLGERIVAAYEDGLALLRRTKAFMPRTVNLITGPSRTADIEQTLLLGAHGPRRLHIVIVHGQGT
jgi:L-lactate dehydrogenase complex protein LldG